MNYLTAFQSFTILEILLSGSVIEHPEIKLLAAVWILFDVVQILGKGSGADQYKTAEQKDARTLPDNKISSIVND